MPFAKTGDIETHYESFGDGPPIVFVHGLGGHCEREAIWAEKAGTLGFRVIVYSVRGHHRTSPCRDPSKYGLDMLATDLGRLLDALSIDRCVIGGGSMGAAIALAFALRNTDRVWGLVQFSPAFGAAPNRLLVEGFRAIAQIVRQRGAEEAVRLLFEALEPLAAQERQNPGLMQDLMDQWSVHDRDSFATIMETLPSQSPFESIDDLASLDVPVLVVAGHDDPIHPLSVAKAYCRRLPDVRLICLDPAARLPERPEITASLVTDFARVCLGDRR